MATLTGKITDVTSKPPENISSITVKAPSARIGGGTNVIVSSPATVDFNRDTGDITVGGLTGGLSWLYIEGEGWTDSIPLAVAEGMVTLVEAIANAAGAPGMADYLALLANLEIAVGDVAQDAVDAAVQSIIWTKGSVTDADEARTPGVYRATGETLGLPEDASFALGSLEVITSGINFMTQRFTTLGSNVEVWIRSQQSPTEWHPWRLQPKEDDFDALATQIGNELEPVKLAVAPLNVERDDVFSVIDADSRVALSVNPDGSTTVGASDLVEDTPGFRIVDSAGRVALEVTGSGTTKIYDFDGSAPGGGSTAATELHTFICAGQSNMSGRGDPVDDVLDVENPRLLQFGHNRRVIEPAPAILDMMDSPLGLSLARQFGLRYLQSQPANVAVLLIPAAHGGTGFTYEPTPGRKTWTKGHADTEENGLYERALAQSQDALAAAQQAGYNVELKGLLWHQGEANGSSLPQNMQAYGERLDELINHFRTDLNAPDLPAVVGEMMPEGMRDSVAKAAIGHVHAATPERVLRTSFAPAPDNTMRHNDFAHFSREGAILLGDSFFNAWPRAVLNVPTGKPRAARNVAAYRVGDQVTVSWSAPMSRVTSYTLEWATSPDGVWQEVTREYPMDLAETFTAASTPVWVRVTAYEDTTPATPTNPIPALGA